MRKVRSPILLQSQIEQAIAVTKSNRSASVYLRVSYAFYKKFAQIYKNKEGVSLFDLHKNRGGRGTSKAHRNSKRGKALDDVLLNKYTNYPKDRLLRRLIASGYIEEKCSSCDYGIRRPTDLKVPLALNFRNGNRDDYRLINLEPLCYNCYFVQVGDLKAKDLKMGPQEFAEIKPATENPNEQLAAGYDLLSEEEKLDILKSLENL